MNDEKKLFAGIIVGTIVIIGVALAFLSGNSGSSSAQKVDEKILIRSDSPKISTSSATVTLVEFGDYQCPACGAYSSVVKQVLSDFKDSITFVFREYPLPMHPNAPLAAQAAVAAGRQGKYWDMHYTLYDKQTDWSLGTDARAKILGYAKEMGLDVVKFTKDMDSDVVKEVVSRDTTDGNTLGVNATPTFYLNAEKIENPKSLADFETLVKAAILKAPKPSLGTSEKYHTHANFKVIVNGNAMDFSVAKYQEKNGKDLDEDIHLHDGKGDLLHIHKKGATLGQFFTSLGMSLTQTCFTDDVWTAFCSKGATDQNKLKMYVNGKMNDSFDTYVPQDLDKIVIIYGPESEVVMNEEAKSVADDACIYSLTCPERGKPPTEECVGGLGTDCSK